MKERFANLFRGYSRRFGRYDLGDQAAPEEKWKGRARTVDQPISLEDYEKHIEGKVGIGVIPLRDEEEGLVNFATIDIDVYKKADQAARKLTHEDVAIALLETPLIVTKSKSGGIHVWMFAKNPVSAKRASDYLKSISALLGVSGAEIFPKQTSRASEEDVGNWINLPYFGDTRKAVIPTLREGIYEFDEVGLEDFLDIAEAASEIVTDDWLEKNTDRSVSRRGTDLIEEDLFYDGPPCLQRLIIGDPRKVERLEQEFKRKVNEAAFKSEEEMERARAWLEKQKEILRPNPLTHMRNVTFFNVGIYLRRRMRPNDPEATLDSKEEVDALTRQLQRIHNAWCVDVGDKEGISDELPRIATQMKKGKWGYQCTKEPLKSFCNRKVCMSRPFGVGTASHDSQLEISGFTIVNTSEKQFYLTIGDTRVHVPDAESLMNQNRFATIVLNATKRMWMPMAEAKYRQMMDELLKNADVIEGPPDTDRFSEVLNALDEFVHSRSIPKGKNDESFFTGRVLWSEDETEAWFRLDHFHSFLKSRGVSLSKPVLSSILVNEMGVIARNNTHIGKRQARPYVVNLAHLRRLLDD